MTEENAFKAWIRSAYLNDEGDPENCELKMMAENISGGVGGMIYYSETSALYDKYKEDLWQILSQMSEELDYKTPLELIASFTGSKDVWDDRQFKNLIVWACAELCAREILLVICASEIGVEI